MLKLLPLVVLSGLVSVSAMGADKHLSEVFDYRGEELVLNVGVGEVELISSDDAQIRVEVVIEPADSGFWLFSSKKEIEGIELDSLLEQGQRLNLELSDGDDVKQHWKISMPADARLKLDMGVGQVKVKGLDNSVNIELGVGEVRVSHSHDYADVSLHSGVGEVNYSINGKALEVQRSLVSQSYEASAAGSGSLEVDVGVGEVEVIRL